MKQFIRNNGLSLVFVLLFIITLWGQAITGWHEHNQQMQEDGGGQISLAKYFSSGHFLQATFENWESEFLQMALFVVLTISLYQKGSAESKDPDEDDPVDKDPNPRKKRCTMGSTTRRIDPGCLQTLPEYRAVCNIYYFVYNSLVWKHERF